MTDRIPLDAMTSDALDALYAERDQLLAELGGRDEEARERWIQKQLNETGLKAMDFRNGMSMEIEPARELVAHWVGAARAMLGDAPNYTETPIEMVVKVGEDPERFAFVLQRVGKLTPHQARQQAEARAERAEAAIARVRAVPRLPHTSQQTGDLGRAYTRGWESVISAIDAALDEPGPAAGGCSAPGPRTEPNNTSPAAAEGTELEKTARVLAALHRSAEQNVSRVIALYERWVKAGPPPIGTSTSRWWDTRLAELHTALNPAKEN